MDIFTKRPKLRWLVPALLAGTVLVVPAAGGVLFADDTPELPKKSAQELLAEMEQADVDGFSGTVVKTADLGVPSLGGDADFAAMTGGTHTLRIWSSGADKSRVALLGELGESDWIHNGDDMWFWSSEDNTAVHERLSEQRHAQAVPPSGAQTQTPDQAAQDMLGLLGPKTKISTDGTAKVAGRSAYELVLTPRTNTSLIGEARLAIDAEKDVPLRVQLYAKGSQEPAFEVGFTHIDFTKPGDEHFTFAPPPGATVTEDSNDPQDVYWEDLIAEGELIGEGWNTVWTSDGVKLDGSVKKLVESLPAANGTWGRGHILTSKLFSVLITDDGRGYIGAVTPERLYEVAGQQ